MSWTTRLLPVVFLACACGRELTPSNEVSGSVSGLGFQNPQAVYTKHKSQGLFYDSFRVLVLVSDDPSACEHLQSVGFWGRTGVTSGAGQRTHSLWLQMPDNGFLASNEHRVGEGLSSDFDPGTTAMPDAGVIQAASGKARLEKADNLGTRAAQASGTFDLEFDAGTFSGSFQAQPCGSLDPGGCSSTGGGLAILGMPLLWVLWRRRGSRHPNQK